MSGYNTEVSSWKEEGIRDGFGSGLLEAGKQDKRVVALSADLLGSCKMDAFLKSFPDRFFQVGVAEQNLAGVAAGLARSGLIPFTGSFAAFSPGRNFDQLRVSVCYSRLPVKTYGGHAGITVGEDGATHQMLEDIAMMRALPNMVVFVPCDKWQAHQGTLAVAKLDSPAYIRGSRAKVPSITSVSTPFSLGKIDVVLDGTDVTIVACGIMVSKAILAALDLRKQGVSACVLNAHTLKPFDEYTLLHFAKSTRAIVVAEEHQRCGGLFGLVCEILALHDPVPIEAVAVEDTFGESGTAEALMGKYGLTAEKIVEKCQAVLLRKL